MQASLGAQAMHYCLGITRLSLCRKNKKLLPAITDTSNSRFGHLHGYGEGFTQLRLLVRSSDSPRRVL